MNLRGAVKNHWEFEAGETAISVWHIVTAVAMFYSAKQGPWILENFHLASDIMEAVEVGPLFWHRNHIPPYKGCQFKNGIVEQ